MAMVGVKGDINGGNFPPTLTEQRSHFGLWCVLSSPLTLSLDLSDKDAVDASWPIITNALAIKTNQDWAGWAGGVFRYVC
jgi:hypothetical protein